LSCSASELPKHNFSLVLKKQNQDLGPIGYLSCDMKRPLISAIANLNEQQLLVLQLYYVEELNVYEIAEVLTVTTGRVSQIKSAAIQKLKSLINKQVT
jgi:DNA-directed RNA polymerase specialized sigma subunit